ncbi:hypothetical protein BABINDRAFT_113384 [Babjeviella inositovora NRRL Y-12698]|uniref:Uncharacterized protein n=1 Tax=Babjeviella inositovora NRRL Y-12698 TaxID=984486 RepID=A0A1E3QWQ6_9ASCO|nr:uncharacterized protein BABINDRAFT_113384 [Babjeviella inositovora NRRL Y-12698]ODQ81934.1 hypothetical protein BABINDRAFT_113384 [Babjeviella inositovora NRRL Y-12698]
MELGYLVGIWELFLRESLMVDLLVGLFVVAFAESGVSLDHLWFGIALVWHRSRLWLSADNLLDIEATTDGASAHWVGWDGEGYTGVVAAVEATLGVVNLGALEDNLLSGVVFLQFGQGVVPLGNLLFSGSSGQESAWMESWDVLHDEGLVMFLLVDGFGIDEAGETKKQGPRGYVSSGEEGDRFGQRWTVAVTAHGLGGTGKGSDRLGSSSGSGAEHCMCSCC